MALHKHKCEACGCVWEHNLKGVGYEEGLTAHECPLCDQEQFKRYDGDLEPEFWNSGKLAYPLKDLILNAEAYRLLDESLRRYPAVTAYLAEKE